MKSIRIILLAILMIPFCMNASGNESEKNAVAIEYIKYVISNEVHFNGKIPDGVIDVELSIDNDGELSVIGIDTTNEGLKEDLKNQIEQIVFPGIEEVHGKVVKCKLKLENI